VTVTIVRPVQDDGRLLIAGPVVTAQTGTVQPDPPPVPPEGPPDPPPVPPEGPPDPPGGWDVVFDDDFAGEES
jgi:hypothetical protein